MSLIRLVAEQYYLGRVKRKEFVKRVSQEAEAIRGEVGLTLNTLQVCIWVCLDILKESLNIEIYESERCIVKITFFSPISMHRI
jgi:hypothetical protein